jgi:GGDEF domain-containing protein
MQSAVQSRNGRRRRRGRDPRHVGPEGRHQERRGGSAGGSYGLSRRAPRRSQPRAAPRNMSSALAPAARNEPAFGLVFFDLQLFEEVNDHHGDEAGDCLLDVARRWRSVTRDGDVPTRYGGDEFVLLITDVPTCRRADVPTCRRAAGPRAQRRSRRRRALHRRAEVVWEYRLALWARLLAYVATSATSTWLPVTPDVRLAGTTSIAEFGGSGSVAPFAQDRSCRISASLTRSALPSTLDACSPASFSIQKSSPIENIFSHLIRRLVGTMIVSEQRHPGVKPAWRSTPAHHPMRAIHRHTGVLCGS